jgi:hypothetical protein
MGIFNIFKKKPVSFEDAGRQLLSVAIGKNQGSIDYYLEKILPQIASYLDVDLDAYDMDVLRAGTLIVCIWAATKTVEHERRQLLDIAYRTSEKEAFNKALAFRYEKYDNAWDESAGKNQQTLAKQMLSDMLFPDELDERVNNTSAMSLMNTFIFNIMEKVRKAKAEIGFG